MGQKAQGTGTTGQLQQNLFSRAAGPPIVQRAAGLAPGQSPSRLPAVQGAVLGKQGRAKQAAAGTKEIALPIVGTVASIIGGMLGGPLAAWGSAKLATSDVGGQINLMYGQPYTDSWKDVFQSTGWQDLGALAGGYIGGAVGGAAGGVGGATGAAAGRTVGSYGGSYAGGYGGGLLNRRRTY